jgi:hypothetical protein
VCFVQSRKHYGLHVCFTDGRMKHILDCYDMKESNKRKLYIAGRNSIGDGESAFNVVEGETVD